jgi:DNA-binding response OmpR family regulator
MHVEIAEGIRSILIVEDEGLVAIMMEDLAGELGIAQIFVCADTNSALDLALTTDIDIAVLDLWVRDGSCFPIADALADRGIPFVFTSGRSADAVEARHAGRPMIGKPFADDDFKLALVDAWTLARSRPLQSVPEGEGRGLPPLAQANR